MSASAGLCHLPTGLLHGIPLPAWVCKKSSIPFEPLWLCSPPTSPPDALSLCSWTFLMLWADCSLVWPLGTWEAKCSSFPACVQALFSWTRIPRQIMWMYTCWGVMSHSCCSPGSMMKEWGREPKINSEGTLLTWPSKFYMFMEPWGKVGTEGSTKPASSPPKWRGI